MLKENNNFSNFWKFEHDIPNSFRGTVLGTHYENDGKSVAQNSFWKTPIFQRMHELINVLPPMSSRGGTGYSSFSGFN